MKQPEQKQQKKEDKESGTIVSPDKKNKLPNTATPMYNYMGIGIGLLLLGAVLLLIQRLRRRVQLL
ncbi:hypothetical protein BTR23_18095 [Alkalihalophilus pseudofirmus]|nr:hypothetical protein BTR23_18095 [Alkalihalophilus pseudofirmus]